MGKRKINGTTKSNRNESAITSTLNKTIELIWTRCSKYAKKTTMMDSSESLYKKGATPGGREQSSSLELSI